MAMAPLEKPYDSDSSDAVSMNVPIALSRREPYPSFPPPPTAPIRENRERIRRAAPLPLKEMPPLPPLPPPEPVAPPFMERGMLPAPVVTNRSRRKTVMERLEGWWDLGLLEKRQTLFGAGNPGSASRKRSVKGLGIS